MPHRVPQSVALRVPLKAYLATDHVTPATGKTIAVVVSKNGGAFGNPSGGATNAVEIANGWYYVDLSTTDTGTLGPVIVRGTSAAVDDVEIPYQVVDATNMGASNLDAAITTRTKPADTQARVTLVDTVTTYTGNTPQTGDNFARIGAAGAGLTALGDTRIAHLDADVSSRSTYAGADTSGTTTLLTRIAAALTITGGKVDVNDKTGFSLSVAGVLAIWHQLTAAIVTASSIGKLLADNVDATISSRSTYAGGAVASVTSPVTVGTNNDKTGYALTAAYDPAKTAAQSGDAMALTSGERTTLVAAVWAAAGRTLTSFGTLVADAATAVWGAATRDLTDKADFSLTSAYDPAKTASQAGDAMTLTAAYDAAKTAGDATIANQTTIDGHVLDVKAKTDALPASPAATGDIPTTAQVADKILGRSLAGGADGGRTVQDALRVSRNKVAIIGTTITVYAEDDTTIAWTGTLTTNAAAQPITAVDPA